MTWKHDVVIVGGCGHVGLPLGIAFAERGLRVALYDTNEVAVARVNRAELPFMESGAAEVLRSTVASGRLEATSDAAAISSAETVTVVIGTPIDKHLNPDPQGVPAAIEAISDRLRDGQLLLLRSTVYPGVTALVERLVQRLGLEIDVAFCPERIAEGNAMKELYSLPQIVSARTDQASERAARFFSILTSQVIRVLPEEAELAKLFTNVWRYIKFATANQLFMIANDFGLDYERIRAAVTTDYPRAADLPGAGFTAGPCLFKDTMQLAAFNNNNFTLGHASMMINEGLPLYICARLEKQYDLQSMTVGILGMAFKAESDDVRSSLAYKLKRILKFKAARVLCSDPYVSSDEDLVPLEEVLEHSDLLLFGAPHRAYAGLQPQVPTVDIYNLLGQGVLV
ncbi:MAG: nucleotide sugar dehydrogenase [Candidatus Dormibacteraeota bacterium]|uniref:Nucleotide sugar dehydrogenase n=1 Tax=Candidatus Amunia macphersoniae TaxID=3127014 RepID=A0A934KLQ1_9BACT|nr:nucleotide sugar dehydrogenase [Candidatus Dormibacteraeota bacterium]